MNAATAGPVRVHVVDSAAGFRALGDEWEALQGDAPVTSVFASFDWQYLWWLTYGASRPLRVLVATDGGKPVGLLALYIDQTVMMRYPVRMLRFVGTGGDTSPDDLGPVLANGREVEVARALAEAVLVLPGWDVLALTDMDPRCAFTVAMQAAAAGQRMALRAGRSERIAFVDLPATWDAWLASLHRDRRYRIRNARKKLNAAHPARFFVWDDLATLNQGIERLVHLHHKRWKSIGEKSFGFSSSEYVEFHRAVMNACFKKDRLRLYCLELDGQIAAMFYFYKFRDRVYLMQSGFDPDFSDVKPGQVLLGYIVEHAIGEKNQVLDFLRGDHRYKDELATGERETVYLTVFRKRPGAWIYRARRVVLPAVKAAVLESMRRLRPPPPKPE